MDKHSRVRKTEGDGVNGMNATLFLIAFVVLGSLSSLAGQEKLPPLELTAKELTGEYCTDRARNLGWEGRVHVTYRNQSQAVIILPIVSQVSGHHLIQSGAEVHSGSKKPMRAEFNWTLETDELIDARGLDKSRPDSRYFSLLGPGDTRELSLFIHLTVPAGSERREIFERGSWLFSVEIDHRFGARDLVSSLGQSWRQTGVLWSEPLTSSGVAIHFGAASQTRSCSVEVNRHAVSGWIPRPSGGRSKGRKGNK